MEGLTYEYVAEHMAEEYEARKADKLNYRYPGRGESYQDVFLRLEPVMMEMLRQRAPLLIIGHQAILRYVRVCEACRYTWYSLSGHAWMISQRWLAFGASSCVAQLPVTHLLAVRT
jgi:broad specificity phosphatase PhoE